MARQFEKKRTKTQQGQGLNGVWLCFVTFIFGYLAASWCDVNQFVHWVSAHVQGQPVVEAAPKIQAQAPKVIHPKLEFYTLLANEPMGRANPEKPAITTADLQLKEVPAAAVQLATSEKESLPKPYAEQNVPASASKTMTSTVSEKSSAPMELALTQPTIEPGLPKIKPEPSRKPIAAAVAKSSGAYSIQVGSFRALTEAQRMKAKLVMKGLGVEIVTVNQQSTYWYRVMVGPFASLSQARTAQLAFARQEHINGMIRKLDV